MEGNGILNLAAVRENRGISLEQIARSTKIGTYYLRAIESGNLERLPEGVYRRSYIRQYARAIDYDEGALLDRCHVAGNEEVPEVPEYHPSAFERLGELLTLLFRLGGAARRAG